jgi:hypothetical protein
MKRILLIIVFCYSAISLFSQTPLNIYYDGDFKITMQEFATFKRIWESPQILNTKFTDIDNNGFKIREGSYKDSKKEGDFVFYYSNSKQIFSKGKYSNNMMIDTWEFYYKNGQEKYRVQFKNNDFTCMSSFDSLGNKLIINGTGPFNYEFVNPYNTDINITGNFKDFNKIGDWDYIINKNSFIRESYDLGKFKKGYQYDFKVQTSKIREPIITNMIFESADLAIMEENHYSNLLYQEDYPFLNFLPQRPDTSAFGLVAANIIGILDNHNIIQIEQPRYPGGEKEFKDLYNISVLRAAINSDVKEGKYFLTFDIDTIGIPRNFTVLRAPNPDFADSTLSALKKIKRWLPAKYNGKPIFSKVSYNIRFKLVDNIEKGAK